MSEVYTQYLRYTTKVPYTPCVGFQFMANTGNKDDPSGNASWTYTNEQGRQVTLHLKLASYEEAHAISELLQDAWAKGRQSGLDAATHQVQVALNQVNPQSC